MFIRLLKTKKQLQKPAGNESACRAWDPELAQHARAAYDKIDKQINKRFGL